MLQAVLLAAILATATCFYLWSSRARLYRDLDRRQHAIVAAGPGFGGVLRGDREMPSFDKCLCVYPHPLQDDEFARVASDIERLSTTERSYLPTHKKGGTVAYETLCREAPAIIELYHSRPLHDLVSGIVGERVMPTPLRDQSSCSVLFYERPGDHIGWHYDHNFYNGRHFTVLLPVVNRNADGTGLSAARFIARIDGVEKEIATPPNTMLMFEGARVLHKATPIGPGERRIVLSMTFSTDPRSTPLRGLVRRLKDIAFFGVRALWT